MSSLWGDPCLPLGAIEVVGLPLRPESLTSPLTSDAHSAHTPNVRVTTGEFTPWLLLYPDCYGLRCGPHSPAVKPNPTGTYVEVGPTRR